MSALEVSLFHGIALYKSLSYYDVGVFLCIELLKQIDKMADDYLVQVRGMSGEQRKEQLNNIQKLFNQSKKFGDDKVQLALQTYEMVRCCRLLLYSFAW